MAHLYENISMKRIMSFFIGLIVFLLILLVGYVLGPKPDYPPFDAEIPSLEVSLQDLDGYVAQQEAGIANLKPNNESRIIWSDSVRKTPYAVVYLHGFSASPMEGHPTHEAFAKRYGCNLYIPRLAGHGLDDKESFLNLSPGDLIESAKKAIAIGKKLGDKLILMSCSTGSTLSIYLAALNSEDIEALILYSPNIALADPASALLTKPWGLQLARSILGTYRNIGGSSDEEGAKYWTQVYRTEGIVSLQVLLEQTMQPQIFEKINMPYFLGYYYKDETEHDQVVSVKAIQAFPGLTSTPEDQIHVVAFPNAGNHVITSDLYSGELEAVQQESYAFAENILGMSPRTDTP